MEEKFLSVPEGKEILVEVTGEIEAATDGNYFNLIMEEDGPVHPDVIAEMLAYVQRYISPGLHGFTLTLKIEN